MMMTMMMTMMMMVIFIKTGGKILTLGEGVTDKENWWDGAGIGKMQGSRRRRITPVDKDIYFPSILKIFVRHSLVGDLVLNWWIIFTLNVKRDNYEMVHFQGVWILRCRIKIEGEEKPSNEIQDQSLWTSTLLFCICAFFAFHIYRRKKYCTFMGGTWEEKEDKDCSRDFWPQTFSFVSFFMLLSLSP